MYTKNEKVIPIHIEDEMKDSYISYAMSVIVGRALPDVRDGLKPVHRRILYAMKELNLEHNKPYKKCARIVGECFIRNTLILTKKGLIPIQDVKCGDLVYTQKGMRRTTALYEMPPKELLTIQLDNGTHNTVTPAQKLKVLNRNFEFGWKKAKDIHPGDQIVLKSGYPNITKKVKLRNVHELNPRYLNENIAYLLGIFMSDGWIETRKQTKAAYRIGVCCNSREIIEKVADILMEEFDYLPSIEESAYEFKTARGETVTRCKYTVRINRGYVSGFLVDNFGLAGLKAPTKKIPRQIFLSPESVIYAFISGLVDGDGSVHNKRSVIHYGSVSEKLNDQLQILLQHLGIFGAKYVDNNVRKSHFVGKRKVRSRLRFYNLEFKGVNAVLLARRLVLYGAVKSKRCAKLTGKRLKKSTFEVIPYAGENIFNELSEKHIGSGWYMSASGEKFRAGVKYATGRKIRYSKDLKEKPLRKSQIVEWGIKEKLEKIRSPLYDFLNHIISDNVYFMRVSSVARSAPEATYDIQVDGEHEFVANGMVSHNCLGKYHPHGDMAVYDSLARMAQDFSLRYPLVDGQGNFGCFTKDTKIKLADGRNLSFGGLIREEKKGRENYTYTYDPKTRQVEIAKINFPRLTRKKATMIEVTLDDGKKIKCTPNHKFMLRDGTYKEAEDLKPAESLMPLYTKLATISGDPNMAGYEMVYQPFTGKWAYAHRLADAWNIENKIYPKNAGRVRHHLDFNKLNNNPSNIRRFSWRQHWQAHYEVTAERHKNDSEYIKKLAEGRREYWDRKGVREKYSKACARLNKKKWKSPEYRTKMIEAVKKKWEDPEFKLHMSGLSSERLKKLWKKPGFSQWRGRLKSEELKAKWRNEDYAGYMAEIMRMRSCEMWKDPVHREHVSKLNKERWLDPKYKKKMSEKSKKQWENPFYKRRMAARYRKKWLEDPSFRNKFIPILTENGRKSHYCRFLKVCEKAVAKYGIINKENYEQERVGYGSRRGEGIVNYKKALAKYFGGDVSGVYRVLAERGFKLKETENAVGVAMLNHKVASVKRLAQKEDVYDLTIEGTHNFALACGVFVHNSIDGDAVAAMRYTEARLAAISDWMLGDIDKNTVRFTPNFDDTLTEPTVLPAALPNLLINGSSGIAVGMATNIPPHNLSEITNGVVAVIDDPEIDLKGLMKHVTGPDFPTGGIICGKEGITEAYRTGRGKIIVHAKASTEELKGGREKIIITEIPYQVNKTNLIESIVALVQTKRVEGIGDIRDESDKDGMRIVIELRKDQSAEVILNQLYKHTQMQTTFGIIMLALVNNRPEVLDLKQIIVHYINHRKNIIISRTKFDLAKAEDRAHILEGLKIAIRNLDKIIALIKKSKDPKVAKEALMDKFELSERQAQAVLEMQLQRLTGLEREKIDKEYMELLKRIEYLKSILASDKKVLEIIKSEVLEIENKYGDERRTALLGKIQELEMEDLITQEDVVVTISHSGYIKRFPVSSYRQQKRGGKGVTGAETKEEDFLQEIFVASTHDNILFFTNKGKAHLLKVYDIPQAGRLSKGKSIVNLLRLAQDEAVTSSIAVKEFKEEINLFMVTKNGKTKKTGLAEFANIRRGGINAVNVGKDDALIGAQLTVSGDEIFIATRDGKAIRFPEKQIRQMGRNAAGVRGINLGKKDEVVGMAVVKDKKSTLLTVTKNGFGKRTEASEYRIQSRGGKGIINIKVTAKNGPVVSLKMVSDRDDIMLVTHGGMVVRCAVKDIRTTGRASQGVRVIRLAAKDSVVSVASVVKEEEE